MNRLGLGDTSTFLFMSAPLSEFGLRRFPCGPLAQPLPEGDGYRFTHGAWPALLTGVLTASCDCLTILVRMMTDSAR